MWWCPNGQGYTCNIDEAGLYTEADVKKMRESDIPIHRDVVHSMVIKHVRLDHLRQRGHLDAYDKAQAQAARLEKARRNRRRRATVEQA